MNFSKELINWYSTHKRELPWRKTKNPYHIWLSEIILQQTQVKQGLPYYEAFVNEFPTVFDLAEATENEVLKLWQGLGYYSRARHLHSTAKHIATNLKGVFPKTYDKLIELKGIGDYTASAISSMAFNAPHAVVDGNVYRVLSRFFDIDTPVNTTQGVKDFKALANTLIDPDNPGDYNQALMEFGAIQCKPKNPYCVVCPLNTACKALQNNTVDKRPVKLPKVKIKTKYFNYLVCVDSEQRILFEKRTGKGIWQNLYQFPLIETDRSLTIEEFHLLNLKDGLLRNKDFEFTLYKDSDTVHKLSHQHLFTKFWIIEVQQTLEGGIPIHQLDRFPSPVLIRDFIEEFNFNTLLN
jgi:A/G-specific adenine glycosylase